MANREFVSGLPGPDLNPHRTLADALNDLPKSIVERRKLDQRKRLYSSRMTPESLALTKRITGEKND